MSRTGISPRATSNSRTKEAVFMRVAWRGQLTGIGTGKAKARHWAGGRNRFSAQVRPNEPPNPSPRPAPHRMGKGRIAGRQSAQLEAQAVQRSDACHFGTNGATGLPLPRGGGEGRGEGAAA